MKYAIIVDPTMTGNSLAYELKNKGIPCIAVYSSIKIYQIIFNYLAADNYRYSTIFSTEQELLKFLAKINAEIEVCVAGSKFGFDTTNKLQTLFGFTNKNYILHNRYSLAKTFNISCDDKDFKEFEDKHPGSIIIGKNPTDFLPTKFAAGNIKLESTHNYYISECFHGTEYIMDYVSFDGRHKLVCVWKSDKDPEDILKYTRLSLFHYRENKNIIDALYYYAKEQLDKVDHKWGPAQLKIIHDGQNLRIISLDYFCHDFLVYQSVKEAFTRNQIQLTIDACLGKSSSFEHLGPEYSTSKHMAKIFFYKKYPDSVIRYDKLIKLSSYTKRFGPYQLNNGDIAKNIPPTNLDSIAVFAHLNHADLERNMQHVKAIIG